VLRYLIESGIYQERLTATGFADLRPVASNNTPEGRSKNRRVEFVLKEKE
jgi:chemotaxis protein MotB